MSRPDGGCEEYHYARGWANPPRAKWRILWCGSTSSKDLCGVHARWYRRAAERPTSAFTIEPIP